MSLSVYVCVRECGLHKTSSSYHLISSMCHCIEFSFYLSPFLSFFSLILVLTVAFFHFYTHIHAHTHTQRLRLRVCKAMRETLAKQEHRQRQQQQQQTVLVCCSVSVCESGYVRTCLCMYLPLFYKNINTHLFLQKFFFFSSVCVSAPILALMYMCLVACLLCQLELESYAILCMHTSIY